MCVAIPMQVVSIDGSMAQVDAAGMVATVGLDLVDDVAVGDYVIVHAGYAIQRLSAEEAEETLAILERLGAPWGARDDHG
jgi:hydrogenase expression/formation protein HypC